MKQVLIAEDEMMLRILAAESLESSGLTVFQAKDGLEAIEVLNGNPDIEILISDVKMPRMNGYELAEAALAMRPNISIIFMTGYSQEPVPPALGKRHIKTFYKPFDFEELANQIRLISGVQAQAAPR